VQHAAVPLADLGVEERPGIGRSAEDEVNADEQDHAAAPGHRQFARAEAVENLSFREHALHQAQQPRRGPSAGDDKVGLSLVVEGDERAARLSGRGLVRHQPRAVLAVQDARADVLGVREEELAASMEGVPVVGPLRRNPLEFGELLAVPLVEGRHILEWNKPVARNPKIVEIVSNS
jgi:hypothetical protein